MAPFAPDLSHALTSETQDPLIPVPPVPCRGAGQARLDHQGARGTVPDIALRDDKTTDGMGSFFGSGACRGGEARRDMLLLLLLLLLLKLLVVLPVWER